MERKNNAKKGKLNQNLSNKGQKSKAGETIIRSPPKNWPTIPGPEASHGNSSAGNERDHKTEVDDQAEWKN